MSNQERGYIDPSVTVLIAAVGGIVFGGPLLVETLGSGMPSATRILVGGAVVVLMHTYAISFAVHEAHWEAHSRGERVGLNRAPVLRGRMGAVAVSLCYAIGVWRFARADAVNGWAIACYGGLGAGVLAGALIAHSIGTRDSP
jgi:hypothetical protein